MTESARLMLVTVRLPRQADHDPHNKIAGPCPLNGELCTDVTGEHHTIAVWVPFGEHFIPDAHYVKANINLSAWPGARVTRVESTRCIRPVKE